MISPHLPPERSANALLPAMLGEALAPHGVVASYVSHPPVKSTIGAPAGVSYVPRRSRDPFSRSKAGAVIAGMRMASGARRAIATCDLVHLHSNGFIVEIGAWLAQRYRKPFVVTLYGTDVSAYDPARNARFGRVVRDAACRVFYSRGLLEHGRRAGLAADPSTVIYAPVDAGFGPLPPEERTRVRQELGADNGPVLLTVKRLHPVAGHGTLLDALPEVVRRFPALRLWLIGSGDSRPALEARVAALGLERHVRFLGQQDTVTLRKYYAAADLFVLPSHVESWGTVMLEAIACGTPVITTDTVGGVEVRDTFPDAVRVVPKDAPTALAAAICEELVVHRRVTGEAVARIRTLFSVEACAAQYLEVYRTVV